MHASLTFLCPIAYLSACFIVLPLSYRISFCMVHCLSFVLSHIFLHASLTFLCPLLCLYACSIVLPLTYVFLHAALFFLYHIACFSTCSFVLFDVFFIVPLSFFFLLHVLLRDDPLVRSFLLFISQSCLSSSVLR